MPEHPYAELAVLERNGFPESRHLGTLVGLAADGTVALRLGDADTAVLPRSSTKPWQALACRTAGLHLSTEATALSAGSHTGEDRHVAVVREVLAAAGLDESALGCPVDWPEDEPTRERLIAAGEQRSRVRMNCSGKHAAMLAASVHNGWDVAGYLDPAHPLQQLVAETVAGASGGPVTATAVDGCGAPLFGTTVLGLARAVRSMVLSPGGSDARAVADAMRAAPEFVGGTGHVNTQVMQLLPGVLAKGGAEGVLVTAAATGQAVAMKVVDGSPRATTVLALAALRHLGVDTSPAAALTEVPVLGGGRPVGRLQLGADLRTALGDATA
ncbi:asparaginase [Modestobacter sp. VKM Ac-2986]|uniref:asparaginase n=1 Tax=Modestobacter sp. VKM Ac-2986 TaxID=3004140 RepID=UPI0022ABC534|nr:asparaginase [Modestobacter sp. VKM Ac-2986]MCZ2830593.1 asparaginase [Modestobacter sp. VKM Ac-2986]